MTNRPQASGVRLRTKALRIPRMVLLKILRAYQYAISPMLLPACRYVPTCSDYAAEAVERYGALRGTLIAGWRLLRCHPFVRGGFDPVPNLPKQYWRWRRPASPSSEITCDASH